MPDFLKLYARTGITPDTWKLLKSEPVSMSTTVVRGNQLITAAEFHFAKPENLAVCLALVHTLGPNVDTMSLREFTKDEHSKVPPTKLYQQTEPVP